MLCDWVGAGKAYNNGTWAVNVLYDWREGHKDEMILHKDTYEFIYFLINIF